MAKQTVEDSLGLDILEFAREGLLHSGMSGEQRWSRVDARSVGVCWRVRGEQFFLSYTLPSSRGHGARTRHHHPVALTYTPTAFGGRRPWFLCPRCHARARWLYLPPAGTRFACRSCHDLTYRSRQRRRSQLEKNLALRDKLAQELDETRQAGRHWLELFERLEALDATLKESDPFASLRGGLPEVLCVCEEPQTKRGRGRPKVKRSYCRRKPFMESPREKPSDGVCFGCREWRELKDPKRVALTNGRPALMGSCPVCQARMSLIVRGGEGDEALVSSPAGTTPTASLADPSDAARSSHREEH